MRGFFILLFLPVAALAHQSSISYSELSPRGREVSATLRFALADLRTQMKLEDSRAPPIPALTRLVLEPFILKAAGVSCALQPGVSAEPDGEDGLALHARWACPQDVEELSVRVGFLELFPPGHAHLSRIEFAPDEVSQHVAQRDEPSFEARRTRSASSAFWRFLLLVGEDRHGFHRCPLDHARSRGAGDRHASCPRHRAADRREHHVRGPGKPLGAPARERAVRAAPPLGAQLCLRARAWLRFRGGAA